jgi:hypothetical protein
LGRHWTPAKATLKDTSERGNPHRASRRIVLRRERRESRDITSPSVEYVTLGTVLDAQRVCTVLCILGGSDGRQSAGHTGERGFCTPQQDIRLRCPDVRTISITLRMLHAARMLVTLCVLIIVLRSRRIAES